MRRLFGALTARGRSFAAAGLAAVACGLLIPEPDLLRIGALLVALVLLSALGAMRARYQLSCARSVSPARLPAGQAAELAIRLANVSRLRTGLLLAEDIVPRELGSRPRFVFGQIGPGDARVYQYQLQASIRGKYTIGPLRVRVADPFGLVSVIATFTSTAALTVTPPVVPLARQPPGGDWPGTSESEWRSIAASGEDDVVPRAYRTGDSLHRVHWKSTARHGELMVRREEQGWRDTVSLFLDTRRSGYSPAMFEVAVTAVASIGAHLASEGLRPQFATDLGTVSLPGALRDTLPEALAVLRPSRSPGLGPGIGALGPAGGQLIAVLGKLTPAQARELAGAWRPNAPGMALLLAEDPHAVAASMRELAGAGWRVAAVPDAARLPAAWRELHGGPHGERSVTREGNHG